MDIREWTTIPPRGGGGVGRGGGGGGRSTSDTSCYSVLAMQPGHGVLMTFHNAATFYAVDGKISYMLVHNILSPHSTQ